MVFSQEAACLQVLYVSRQATAGNSRRKVTRRVDNEEAIMAMLRSVPGMAPQMVDLAAHTLLDQLRLLSSTDVLIGVLLGPEMIGTRSAEGAMRGLMCQPVDTWSIVRFSLLPRHQGLRSSAEQLRE